MKYLCTLLYDVAILVFTAYMVVNVHPIWALMVFFLQAVREIKRDDSGRDSGTEHFEN